MMTVQDGPVTTGVRVLGGLFVAAGLVGNEWTLTAWLSEDGVVTPAYRLLIWTGDVVLVSLGVALVVVQRRVSAFRWMVAGLVVSVNLAALLAISELVLAVTERSTTRQQYALAYRPFTHQYLHPFYYFFFPQDPDVVQDMNNDVVSLDPQGFRGVGPEARGGRDLAFLLGGSVAFGHGSTSDETTIAGYLNQLQTRYHVVNAGVPSWNSTQEFYRLALQLIDYRPSLLIILDGFNDVVARYHHTAILRRSYPPGTPESYEHLEQWFNDIREQRVFIMRFTPLTRYMFPRTIRAINQILTGDGGKAPPAAASLGASDLEPYLKEDAEATAAVYLRNLELMSVLGRGYGARVVAFWQPWVLQHEHVSVEDKVRLMDLPRDYEQLPEYMRYFHAYVFAHKSPEMELIDFSAIFDQHYAVVPVDEVFIGAVHLSDAGCDLMAKDILKYLQQESQPGLAKASRAADRGSAGLGGAYEVVNRTPGRSTTP